MKASSDTHVASSRSSTGHRRWLQLLSRFDRPTPSPKANMKPEKVMRLMTSLMTSAGGLGRNARSWMQWAVIIPHTSSAFSRSRSAARPLEGAGRASGIGYSTIWP